MTLMLRNNIYTFTFRLLFAVNFFKQSKKEWLLNDFAVSACISRMYFIAIRICTCRAVSLHMGKWWLSLRDRRHITFVTLNRCCLLSKKNPCLLFLTDDIRLDGILTINKWKIHAWLHCISCFEGISYRKLQDIATSSFICCCFTLVFKTWFKII